MEEELRGIILGECLPLAEGAISRGASFQRRQWKIPRADGAPWNVAYCEDWERRYLPASRNGRALPRIHVWRHAEGDGGRLCLLYGGKPEMWRLVLMEACGEGLRAAALLGEICAELNVKEAENDGV